MYEKKGGGRMRQGLIETATKAINEELLEANKKFRAFASTHEGYAVTLEELQELKEDFELVEEQLDRIWQLTKDNADKQAFEEVLEEAISDATMLVSEAIQTAAMLRKFQQFNDKRV